MKSTISNESTYLNCLSNHGFLIEQVVEESAYHPEDADIFQEGKYYSAVMLLLLRHGNDRCPVNA